MKQLLRLIGLAVVVTVMAVVPLAAYAQGGSTNSKSDNFIFINYIGEELHLDLDDVAYTVPGINTVPGGGKLTLSLAPGWHKYAANVPGVDGAAGDFLLNAGAVIAKAARFDQTAPVVKNGILLEKPKTYVSVFDFDPNASPVTATTVVTDTWQPGAASAGKSSVAWVNYTGDELTVDLNGQLYKVSPMANTIPGRLQIEVAPGKYTFTASIPRGSVNGDINAVAGQVAGVKITADLPEEQKMEVGKTYDVLPPLTLHAVVEDFTAKVGATAAVTATVTTTPTVAVTTTVAVTHTAAVTSTAAVTGTAATTPTVTVAPGLLIKNYAADTFAFTINGQTYRIPYNGQQALPLPAGTYSFTASTPYAAVSRSITMLDGQHVVLSMVLGSDGSLVIYQE